MQTITNRQATFLFTMYYMGGTLLFLPTFLAVPARQDAWIAAILAVAVHFALIPIFAALARMSGSAPLGDFLSDALGPWAGKSAYALLLIVEPFLLSVFSLNGLGVYASTTILAETPQAAINALMMVPVVIGLYSGIRTVGRASEALFPFVFAVLAVLFLSLMPGLRFHRLLPIMENGIGPVATGSVSLLCFPYLEIVTLWMVTPRLKRPERLGRILRVSALISGIAIVVMTALIVLTVGPGIASRLMFPGYFVSRTISIGGFYERVEAIFAMVWYMTTFFRVCVLLHVLTEGIGELLSMKNGRRLLVPLSLIVVPLAESVWPDPASAEPLLVLWPIFQLAFAICLPLLIMLAAKWKKGVRAAGQGG